eukprot:5936397-Pyramimonas_sp.AAC.1
MGSYELRLLSVALMPALGPATSGPGSAAAQPSDIGSPLKPRKAREKASSKWPTHRLGLLQHVGHG